jgi:hypothetical protein
MTNWHDFVDREGTTPSWPCPVDYEKENEIDTDVLVIGGRIAGCCVMDCPCPGAININWPLQQRGSWKDKVTGKVHRDNVAFP